MKSDQIKLRRDRRPSNLPEGWKFIGDLWIEGKVHSCLFVTDKGALRVQPEGCEWEAKSSVIVPREFAPVEIYARTPR